MLAESKMQRAKKVNNCRFGLCFELLRQFLYQFLVSSCANEFQNQRNCLLSSHVIIQLIFNTAKQRYIYSKQTKKSENKDTVIKFLLSCNIRSLCNTAHCSERYVPTTGHCRQNTRINILINGSATTDLPPRMMGMVDDKASRGCPAYTSVGEKKSGAEHQQGTTCEKKHLRNFIIEQMNTHQ